MGMQIPARLGWGNSNVCVFMSFPRGPPPPKGSSSQLPTLVAGLPYLEHSSSGILRLPGKPRALRPHLWGLWLALLNSAQTQIPTQPPAVG